MVKLKSSYEYLTGGADEYKGFQERNRGLTELARGVCAKYAAAKDGALNADKPTVKQVDIFSDGCRMSGSLWFPKEAANTQAKSLPAVVCCHGWGGIRAGLDLTFARTFANAGFIVVTFDYRGWGDSDGPLVAFSLPKSAAGANAAAQEAGRASDGLGGDGYNASGLQAHVARMVVDMDWQLNDIESALDFLCGETLVDPSRVAVWGISQGGGHVISIGARCRGRVAAIVSQVPSMGDVGAGNPLSRTDQARADAAKRARGLAPISVPQGIPQNHLTGMDGVPNLRKLVRYRPLDTAHLIECPLLVVDAKDEEIFDRTKNGRRAYEIARQRNPESEYSVFSGRHYDAYDGPNGQFKEGMAKSVEFLQKHLSPHPTARAKL